MSLPIWAVDLQESLKNKYRELAKLGFGDQVIHEGNDTFVVFRMPSGKRIFVKQFGGRYTDVFAEK